MNAARPDDTLLHAWLDGELAPAQRAEIDAWLAEHPEDGARLDAWAADAELLREKLAGVLDEPVPDALAQTLWRSSASAASATDRRERPGWQRWAAAAAIFALGGAVGAALMGRLDATRQAASVAAAVGEDWVQRAAIAHSVYVPEVRHPVEVKAQEEQHLSGWLTKRLDLPVKVFDLRAQGFELVGGRLLPDTAGPSAQLMYQALRPPAQADSAGADASSGTHAGASAVAGAPPLRVTVYVRKPEVDTPAAFRYEQQGGLGLFYWVEGNGSHRAATGYALVGALPKERLLALAEAIYKQSQP
jgi:anti-sigma factor RsiW